MSIGIYLRLSLSDGDLVDKKESNSIENQRLLIREFIDSQDDLFGEITEYVDDGYTGTNFERPGFKKLIEDGRLGDVYQIRVKLIRRRGIPGLGGWFTTKALSGGGGIIDISVHALDLSMYVTGLWNPTAVSAKTYSKFGSPIKDYHYVSMWAGPPKMDGIFDVDDYAAGLIRFGDKATLSFEVAWACNAHPENCIEILGDKGGVKLEGNNVVLLTEYDNRPADIKLDYDPQRDGFADELRKFIAAVNGEGEVPATGEQGIIMMRVLDAIYKSSDLNKEVEI